MCHVSLNASTLLSLTVYQYLNLIFTLSTVQFKIILTVTPYLVTTSIIYLLSCRQLLDSPCCILLDLLSYCNISRLPLPYKVG
jgi:hypothetical protein